MHPSNNSHTFEQEVRPWIHHRQVSIYLQGRDKPITGLTVCSVSNATIVGRWNGSTHLIPTRNVQYIRFAPGADPVDHPRQPLHAVVSTGRPRTGKAAPVGYPPGLKRGDASSLAQIMATAGHKKGG